MIILGLDPHPTTPTAVALDSRGVVLDSLSVQNNVNGLNQLWAWSARFEEHCWAIEGAGNRCVAPLLALLFARNQSVYHIHPSLTSQYRARRGKKKNDLVDADQGYTGDQTALDAAARGVELQVIKRPTGKKGFILLPQRWIVERSFAWTSRFRRLGRDFERLSSIFTGFHFVTGCILLLNKLHPRFGSLAG